MLLESMGRRYVAAGPIVGILLADGTAIGALTVGSTFTVTLTTTKTNNVIALFIESNGATPTNVSSSNVTWAGAVRTQSTGTNNIYLWYGTTTSILSAEVITITVSAPGVFASAGALAVNGCDISSNPASFVDPNGSLPANGTSGVPNALSTTKNATMIFGGFRGSGDGAAASGYTGTDFSFGRFEYQIFATPQSGLSISDTMTGVNGWVADALMASGQ